MVVQKKILKNEKFWDCHNSRSNREQQMVRFSQQPSPVDRP